MQLCMLLFLLMLLLSCCCSCCCGLHVVSAVQGRLEQVRDEVDPVDLSHIMWALMYYNSYPDAQAVDALLATLPSQLSNAEPTVSLR